jgi:hypothetical protein
MLTEKDEAEDVLVEEEENSIVTIPTSNTSTPTYEYFSLKDREYFSLIDRENSRYYLKKEELNQKLQEEEKRHRRAILQIKKEYGRGKPSQKELQEIRRRVEVWSRTSRYAGHSRSNPKKS